MKRCFWIAVAAVFLTWGGMTHADAHNWVFIGYSTNGAYYADMDSVEQVTAGQGCLDKSN